FLVYASHSASPGANRAHTSSCPRMLAGVASHSAPTVTVSPDSNQGSNGSYVESLPPPLPRTSTIQLEWLVSTARGRASSARSGSRASLAKLGSINRTVRGDSTLICGTLLSLVASREALAPVAPAAS